MRQQDVRSFLKSLLSFLLILIASYNSVLGQLNLCTGNLSENIFASGDFGSGSSIVFPTDPGLAPGFIYTTQVPPDDGEYTITNDINKWPSNFPTWLPIGDNSADPNGYMMVVNASVNSGIFYEQVINDICEYTSYEFSSDVINLIKIGIAAHTLPDISFLIDDVEVYSTGLIPQDEIWHTFGFIFTTGPGQNSLKLTLRNNSPGGSGNDLALDNISFRVCGPESTIAISQPGRICDNTLFPTLTAQIQSDTGSIQWQISVDSMTWTNIPGAIDSTYLIDELSSGIYFYRFLYSTSSANLLNSKCRIISGSIRVEIVPVEFIIRDTICEGMTVNFGGIDYGETGIYQQFFTAANGCDSVVSLDLMVFPDPPIMADFIFTPPSCKGAIDGSISVLSVSGTRPPYIFLINDSIVPAPSTSVVLPAGIYIASIENEFGCFVKKEIVIPEGPVLEINTIEDVTIILGHSIVLETSANLPIFSSIWEPPTGLNCSNCLSPLASPTEDQTYVITAMTIDGCVDMDTITLRVDTDPVMYIPNIFSPNDDQVNDFFEIFADPLNIISFERVLIFDRWGGILSEKANVFNEGQSKLWDGLTRWGPANPGVYVYLINYTLANGTQKIVRGTVTVLK